jgi:hypothetical protein
MRAAALAACAVAAAGASLAPAGCAQGAASPGRAAAAFGSALERGDTAAAYALISADTQRRLSYDAFVALYATDPAEAKAFGRRVAVESARTPPRAEVAVGPAETLPLVLEGGGWRVAGMAFEPWGQGTPRAALRTFIRALEERRYEIVLRLVPNRYRGELTADKLRQYWEQERKDDHFVLLARLRAAAESAIVESGEEAHMPYGPDQEVRFVREDGRWKIESPR